MGPSKSRKIPDIFPSEKKSPKSFCRSAGRRIVTVHKLALRESRPPLTPILLKSIAPDLPFLSRYFCKSMPSSWQKALYAPPICITMHLPFVLRYFCRSIRVRGRWNTSKLFPGTKPIHAGKPRWRINFFARIHAGPAFALAQIQEDIFEELYFPHIWQVFGGIHFGANACPACVRTRANTANYLCIGFLPEGILGQLIMDYTDSSGRSHNYLISHLRDRIQLQFQNLAKLFINCSTEFGPFWIEFQTTSLSPMAIARTMGLVVPLLFVISSGETSKLPHKVTRPQLGGPFFVLKFVRSRGEISSTVPKSLVTVRYCSNTKMAVNSR